MRYAVIAPVVASLLIACSPAHAQNKDYWRDRQRCVVEGCGGGRTRDGDSGSGSSTTQPGDRAYDALRAAIEKAQRAGNRTEALRLAREGLARFGDRQHLRDVIANEEARIQWYAGVAARERGDHEAAWAHFSTAMARTQIVNPEMSAFYERYGAVVGALRAERRREEEQRQEAARRDAYAEELRREAERVDLQRSTAMRAELGRLAEVFDTPPVLDGSVVDLRFLGDRPGTVDPHTAGGPMAFIGRTRATPRAIATAAGRRGLVIADVPAPRVVTGRLGSPGPDTPLPMLGVAARAAFPEAVALASRHNVLDAVNYLTAHSEPVKVSGELAGRAGGILHIALGFTTEFDAQHAATHAVKVTHGGALAWRPKSTPAREIEGVVGIEVKGATDGQSLKVSIPTELNVQLSGVEIQAKWTPGDAVSGRMMPTRQFGHTTLAVGTFIEYSVKTRTAIYGPAAQVKVGTQDYYVKLEIDAGSRWVEKPWYVAPDPSLSRTTTDVIAHWTRR